LATVLYPLVYDNDNDSDRKEKKKSNFQGTGQTIFSDDARDKMTKISKISQVTNKKY
jgi:hypothetical protein